MLNSTSSKNGLYSDISFRMDFLSFSEPVNTELIKESKKKNAEIIYGYEMLLGQAVRSFEIWLEQKAPYDEMKKALLGGFS